MNDQGDKVNANKSMFSEEKSIFLQGYNIMIYRQNKLLGH